MTEKHASFTTHLRPSRCLALLADSEAVLDPDERKHLDECPGCRDYMLRVVGAVPPRPSAELLLATVERLRERADFPAAFKVLTSVVLIDGRPEVLQQAALASARLHREMGYFEIAVEQFRSLLQSPGLGVAARAACLNNLAWFERQKGGLDDAAAFLRQAAELARSETSLAVLKEYAETLHQQAVLMMTRGQYDEASSLIADALRIRVENDGPERLNTARSLLIQGAVRSLQGDPAAGLELLAQALEIRENALGPNHADVADLLCRMGDMYKAQGLRDEAKRAYDQAILSFQKSASTLLGTIGMARCHARLAEIYADWNRPDLARGFAARALPVLDRYRECDQTAYESAVRHAVAHTG
jgi:tetratricopeptide (TPR) repeat protein